MKNYIILFILGASLGFSGGFTFFNYNKKEIKLSCPSCPSCTCTSNSIDINKLKDFRGRFTVNQNYQLEGDSMTRELIVKDIKKIITEIKLSRCK